MCCGRVSASRGPGGDPGRTQVRAVSPARRAAPRKAGLTLRGPALWGAAAAAVLVLAGGGYLAFTAGPPTTVGTAALSLSAEQLEQALAERRKADTLAAEKRRLEEEARQKAEAETEAKRQAEAELEQARQARQKAEEELAELKARIAAGSAQSAQPDQAAAAEQRAAEEAAQRKAEADAAALRQAEEEARKKFEAEAEAKRQAEETLAKAEAERRRAEEEARVKAEAEQAALRQSSEEAQRKAVAAEREKAETEAKAKVRAEAEADKVAAKQKEEAEAAEKGVRLEPADRQRLQVALTSLGFDTRGSDGMFGPRSRDMIAGWQKKAGAPPTGFLTAAQRDQLLRSAAPAITRWDEEQKKIEDEKKKPDATQAATTLNQSGTGASAPPASGPSGSGVAGAGSSRATALRDGTYGGGLAIYTRALSLELRMHNGSGTGTVTSSTCGAGPMSLTGDASGNVTGEMKVLTGGGAGICDWVSARITGRADGGKLLLAVKGSHIGGASIGEATLVLGGASQAAAAGPPALPSPDGRWRGTYACSGSIGLSQTSQTTAFTINLELQLANGSGSWKASNVSGYLGLTFEIRVSVGSTGVSVTRLYGGGGHGGTQGTISGQYEGSTIRATGWETPNGVRECTMTLTRA